MTKIIITGMDIDGNEFGIYNDAAIVAIKASQEVRFQKNGWCAILEGDEITVSNSDKEVNGEIPYLSFREEDLEEIIIGDQEVSSLKEAYDLLQ